MQSLAQIFITLVTLANTLVPSANIAKVLDMSPLPSGTQAVLSEETDSEETDSKKQKSRLKQQELLTKKQELAATRQEKKQEFKEKLVEVRSEKKREIVTKIDQNIEEMNQKWVDRWIVVLDRLEEILVKLEARSQEEEVVAKIADARTKIATARVSVNTQAGKIYVIELTSQTGVGLDVKKTINQFHNDIKNTKELVMEARQAVVEVVKLVKGNKTNEE